MAKSAEMNEMKLIHSSTAKTKRCRQCKPRLNSLYPTDPSHSENTLGTRCDRPSAFGNALTAVLFRSVKRRVISRLSHLTRLVKAFHALDPYIRNGKSRKIGAPVPRANNICTMSVHNAQLRLHRIIDVDMYCLLAGAAANTAVAITVPMSLRRDRLTRSLRLGLSLVWRVRCFGTESESRYCRHHIPAARTQSSARRCRCRNRSLGSHPVYGWF